VLVVMLVVAMLALVALLRPWHRLRRPVAPGRSQGRRAPGASGPSPRTWTDLRDSAWTAEIQWRSAADAARFRAVALPPGARKQVTLAESPRLEWPPRGEAGVESLVRAVADLEHAVVAAGWEPTDPGASWFARRFVWPRTDRVPEPSLERARAAKRA
jgi:hypothetical protein